MKIAASSVDSSCNRMSVFAGVTIRSTCSRSASCIFPMSLQRLLKRHIHRGQSLIVLIIIIASQGHSKMKLADFFFLVNTWQ